MKNFFYKTLVLSVIVVMALTACAPAAPQATAVPQPTATTAPKPLPTVETQPTATSAPTAASNAVTSLDNVKSATIQIEAEGTFIDPQVGMVVNGAGRGSGFIIDPSGIAVTNNHVVTGSALLKVWVGGNKDNVYNARVLGSS